FARDQCKERDGKRVGERRQRRRGAHAMDLRFAALLETLQGDGNRDEEQPDEHARDACRRGEEVVQARWRPARILTDVAATGSPPPRAQAVKARLDVLEWRAVAAGCPSRRGGLRATPREAREAALGGSL